MSERNHRIIGPGFHQKVYALVRQVPYGQVSTYGDIAKRLGNVKIARHIGWALSALTESDSDVPWHRIINAKGGISARPGSHQMLLQTLTLQNEGVEVSTSGMIDLSRFRWRPKR